jgi:hypothetical protein
MTYYTSNKQPHGHIRDVKVGAATIPWCQKDKCWLLPSGILQTDRRVYSRAVAVRFGHRIDNLIGRFLA